MTYQIQQGGKRIKVEDENEDENQEQVLCRDFWNEEVLHGFWNQVSADVLVEIFIRHPDCRSALRTSTVCHQWHSLISGNPQFIDRFNSHHHQHQDRYPPVFLPWTIMFRKSRFFEPLIPGPEHFRTLCQVYSEEWVFLHGKTLSASCLDFLPSPVVIKASCNDLFLVSPSSRYTDDHYVCNPITKQFVQLPSIPSLEDTISVIYDSYPDVVVIGYGLVRTTNARFKVVGVLPPYDYPPSMDLNLEPTVLVPVTIFCSESRNWETRSFPCPGLNTRASWGANFSVDIVTCNGILYWLGTSDEWERVLVYLDLSREKCGTIDVPWCGMRFAERIGIVRVSGGLHELRLVKIQTDEFERKENVPLKVWRLNVYDGDWCLVHDTNFDRCDYLFQVQRIIDAEYVSERHPLVGSFVHPTNGDSVFIVRGKNVVEYNLVNSKYKKMGELLETVYDLDQLSAFIMVRASDLANLDF